MLTSLNYELRTKIRNYEVLIHAWTLDYRGPMQTHKIRVEDTRAAVYRLVICDSGPPLEMSRNCEFI